MMPLCPKCGTELPADFGMVTCPGCGEISVIDMDGGAQPPEAQPISPPEEEVFTESSEPAPEPSFEPPAQAEMSAEEALSEVADFGNSDLSQGKDGLFVFNITISGIDTKDLRDAVRDSLSDKRFLWDIRQIMDQIHAGELVLREINSVKATIVVNRLKGLPLEIRWEQHAIIG